MFKTLAVSALILSCGLFAAAQIEQHEVNPGGLRVVPMEPTSESDNITVKINFPAQGDVKMSNPVDIEATDEGFPLGVVTDVPRKSEIYNDPKGQTIHFFIDDKPYFAVNEMFVDALDNNELYYTSTIQGRIPFHLSPGAHVIRAFPCRSFNESLKGDGCYAVRLFYFQKKEPLKGVDLSGPYLTYNEPQGDYDYSPNEPILLDFYITNCQLSQDGYKVQLWVDGKKARVLTRWIPYYLYGLSKGRHKIRLQLLDPSNKVISGLYNDTEREIVLK